MLDRNADKLDRFCHGIVQRKVSQMLNHPGFTSQDRPDLNQVLIAHVLQSLASFDPTIAHRNRFVTTVVERKVASMIRDKQAAKRDHRRISSLNVTITIKGEGPVELAQTIGSRERDAQRHYHPRSGGDHARLKIDLKDMIATLPESLREVAERCKFKCVSEVARDLGIPRSTLNERLRAIRMVFEKAGLKDYLQIDRQ